MKPNNTRQPLLLDDGEPVRCAFYARGDTPPSFRDECETWATELLEPDDTERFREWREDHPQAIINLRPGGYAPLCDTHSETIWGCLE